MKFSRPEYWRKVTHNLSLLQGIFPTQGSSPDLPHCKWILYQLSYKGSQRISGCVSYPFSCYKNYLHYYVCLTCSLSLLNYICFATMCVYLHRTHLNIYIYIYLFIYLAVQGLNCGMWNHLWHAGSSFPTRH